MFYFYISMHYFLWVHITDSWAYTQKNTLYDSLIIHIMFMHVIKQTPILSIFQNDICNLILFIKTKIIHLDDIGMIQAHMDLNLIQSYFPADFFYCYSLSSFQTFC